MTVPSIPDRLDKAIIFLRGEQDGRAWLDALPARIADYAARWSLTLDSIADSGAMSCCVYSTTIDGTQAVLKIPVDQESGHTEMQLLDRWSASEAAPAVLQRDYGSGVFLMTRIVPGTLAWPDDGGTDSDQFGELLTRLNTTGLPAAPALKDLAEVMQMRLSWAHDRFADPRYSEAMARFTAPVRLQHAETVLTALFATTTKRYVLHADLQAKNILQGPHDWYAIDPLGAVGDINAEAALWIAIQDGPSSIPDRLAELAEHPLLHRSRLTGWTYVLAVAEYRSYLPVSGERMTTFVENIDPRVLIDEISSTA